MDFLYNNNNNTLVNNNTKLLRWSIFLNIHYTFELQQSLLPPSIQTLVDKSTETAEITWAALSAVSKPVGQQYCIQKAWDGLVSANQVTCLLLNTSNDMDG